MENPEGNPRPARLAAIDEKWDFKKNKCSHKASLVLEIIEEIDIDLWYDKHYYDRHFIGDENGKRDGIEMHIVQDLVLKSVKHLFLYSGHLNKVSFINHTPTSSRAYRIVLQENVNGVLLNVAIEVHFLAISYYEITVKTAMKHDEFKMSDGQYVIEIEGDGSILKKFENFKLVEVCKF